MFIELNAVSAPSDVLSGNAKQSGEGDVAPPVRQFSEHFAELSASDADVSNSEELAQDVASAEVETEPTEVSKPGEESVDPEAVKAEDPTAAIVEEPRESTEIVFAHAPTLNVEPTKIVLGGAGDTASNLKAQHSVSAIHEHGSNRPQVATNTPNETPIAKPGHAAFNELPAPVTEPGGDQMRVSPTETRLSVPLTTVETAPDPVQSMPLKPELQRTQQQLTRSEPELAASPKERPTFSTGIVLPTDNPNGAGRQTAGDVRNVDILMQSTARRRPITSAAQTLPGARAVSETPKPATDEHLVSAATMSGTATPPGFSVNARVTPHQNDKPPPFIGRDAMEPVQWAATDEVSRPSMPQTIFPSVEPSGTQQNVQDRQSDIQTHISSPTNSAPRKPTPMNSGADTKQLAPLATSAEVEIRVADQFVADETPLISTSRSADPVTVQLTAPTAGLPNESTRFAAQVAELLVRQSDKAIELALNPEELGKVRMSMTVSEAGVAVMVSAERPETLDLMRKHIDALAESLRDMGHHEVSFEFNSGHDRDPRQPAGFEGAQGDADTSQTDPSLQSAAPIRNVGLDLRL